MKNNYVLGGSASCFDLFNLERQFAGIEEAPVDFVHFDVVDGRFNQCIILGLPTLQAIRPHTKLPIEVHLAVYEPELYIKQFVDAGADIVTIHPEGTKDVLKTFEYIRSLGAKPALAFRSETVATFLAVLELVRAGRITIADDETLAVRRGKTTHREE